MISYPNNSPKFSQGLAFVSKNYFNSQIILVVIGGISIIVNLCAYYLSIIPYSAFNLNIEVWGFCTFLIVTGLQMNNWGKFKQFLGELEFNNAGVHDQEYQNGAKNLKKSRQFLIARKITTILVGIPLYWMESRTIYTPSYDEDIPLAPTLHLDFPSAIIICVLIIGGLSLTGGIFHAIGYSKIENWLKQKTMYFPQNIELIELKSALHSIYIGVVLRIISPFLLMIGYLGILTYLGGWITVLIGYNKFANRLKLSNVAYRANPETRRVPIETNFQPTNPNKSEWVIIRSPQTPLNPHPGQREIRYCPNCGENIPNYAKFCTTCGTDLSR